MSRRRDMPEYRRWYADYAGETPPEKKGNIHPEAAEKGARRRRIEDLREGLRLDADAFGEVWDGYSGVTKL